MSKALTCVGTAALLLLHALAFAQTPPAYNSSDIYLHLKKLNVLGSVLYIAAHPDDENNALLPYLAKEKMYRTAYLSLTRGDGGQNLIGSEQGFELGMIRTQELLAARRLDGAEQYFSRAYEFGFSKSAEEALHIWDKEKILSDVVWIIRQYQPDIIIKRFPPDKRAGHGHHAASSRLADEAFIAAADPNRFPEQFRYGVKPWQAKRILWNGYNWATGKPDDSQLNIEIGNYDPMLGKSAGEIGGEARSMHKSQGEGRPRRRGSITEYFSTTAGDSTSTDLMGGVETSWRRLPGGEAISSMVDKVTSQYDFTHPENSVTALVNVYNAIAKLRESNWRNKKLAETQALIEECAGLFAEAVTPQETAVLGDSLRVSFTFNNRSNIAATVNRISFGHPGVELIHNGHPVYLVASSAPVAKGALLDSATQLSLGLNQNVNIDYTFRIPDNDSLSQPYWLARKMQPGYFDVRQQELIGSPESEPNYVARFSITIAGQRFVVERPLQYKYTDPVKGELYEPLIIVPKLTISVTPTVALPHLIPAAKTAYAVNYLSNITAPGVPLSLYLHNGSTPVLISKAIVDLKKGQGGALPVSMAQIAAAYKGSVLQPSLAVELNGTTQVFNLDLRTIKYDHIPFLNYFFADTLHVIADNIKTVGKKIGYITGAGDKVGDALTIMGYDVKYLADADINYENLAQYDAIVIGIRAHNIYDFLSSKNDILNKYVANGGNLIMQYVKSDFIGNRRISAGPYPFSVATSSRVTEENAPVTILEPAHPVFNYPNKIIMKDFEGWVQERSTYQAVTADEHYQKLLEMHDTGEAPGDCSLLVAKYGKGNFAYVSLVLFRQLPAGVGGAYRLMANLIALPKNK